MVFFQFGNLDFMGSVSGNETKIAPQYKQLMNKLFLCYFMRQIQSFDFKKCRVSKKIYSSAKGSLIHLLTIFDTL